MPELRLLPIEDVFSKAQIKTLEKELKELGAEGLAEGDETDDDFEDALTEDQLTDFADRLEAHDLACDVYLPVEFEGRVEVGDYGVGSAHALLEVLEEMREELDIDEELDEEEEEELDLEVIQEQLRFSWRVFLRAANACVEKQLPLHIIS